MTEAPVTTPTTVVRVPTRLRRVAALSPADRQWLAAAWIALVRSRLGLRFRPITQVPARAHAWDRDRFPSREARLRAAHSVGRAVDVAASFLPRTRCLPKALAAQALVRRLGLPSRLHVGFLRTAQGAVRGHAWLECEGEVVVGEHAHLDAFVPTMVFDA